MRAVIRRLTGRLLGWTAEPPDPMAALAEAKRRGTRRVILAWNKGLGDIALGIVGLVVLIRDALPRAEVVVLTREDLAEAFTLVPGVDAVHAVPGWRREASRWGSPTEAVVAAAAAKVGALTEGTLVLPDVRWGPWWAAQVGRFVPRLLWRREWDALAEPLVGPAGGERRRLAIHVDSETGYFYRYNKNWGSRRWRDLFAMVGAEAPPRIFLLGKAVGERFALPFVVDLRGRTGLREALAVILSTGVCIAPDSGLLTFAYFLDVARPLSLISLWASAEHGILRYGVDSPNPRLRHAPLVGRGGDIMTIEVAEVARSLEGAWV